MNVHAFEAHAARIDALVEEIESWEASEARSTVTELLQALLQLHSDGLACLLGLVAQRDLVLLDMLAQDAVVARLLLLHGLHPISLEKRVNHALEEVRPSLQAHGGSVELLSLSGGVARLRLQGNCHGCPASAMTLKQTIIDALERRAPDLEGLEVEGITEKTPPQPLIQLHPISTWQGAGETGYG